MSYDVLVTGGSGFLGAQVVSQLRSAGMRVASCSTRLPEDAPDSSDYFALDIRDEPLVRRTITELQPTTVVHMASSMDVTGDDPASMISTNITGSTHVLDAAREGGVKRFLYASSIMVYGPGSRASGPVTEAAMTDPQTLYGAAKVFTEQLAQEPHYTSQMSTAGLRFTTIYGPGRLRRGACGYVVDAFLAPSEIGPVEINQNQATDVIHVEDAANAVTCAINAPSVSGVYNIGHHQVTGEDIAAVTLRLRPHTHLSLIHGADSSWPSGISSQRAQEELRWQPRYSIEAGAESTISWFERTSSAR